MSTYKYKAMSNGKVVNGVVEAASEKEAIDLMKSKNLTPLQIDEAKKSGRSASDKKEKEKNKREKEKNKKEKKKNQTPGKDEEVSPWKKDITLIKRKPKLKDIATMCKQMSTMLSAGMPIVRAVTVAEEQTENKVLKETLGETSTELRKGFSLSTVVRRYPKVFPSLFLSMVEAGELTGTLDNSLEELSEYFTKENRINGKIKNAMVYPIVLLVLAIAVLTIMLVFVLPKFLESFTQTGTPLPRITQSVVNLSDSIINYWYVYIAVVLFIFAAYKIAMKFDNFVYRRDAILSGMPGIGKPVKKIASSRYCRTLSILLSSGIPIVTAVDAAGNVTNNQVVKVKTKTVVQDIKNGRSLSVLLEEMNFFPPLVTAMVSVGEESGNVEELLSKTADYYDDEMDDTISKLISILEPVMIIIMAIITAYIVIAMLLPIIESYNLVA